MIITFEAKSKYLCDIKIPAGVTVAKFREMLQDKGYDVKASRIEIWRSKEKDKLIGMVNSYVLQPGDYIRFYVCNISRPYRDDFRKRLHECGARGDEGSPEYFKAQEALIWEAVDFGLHDEKRAKEMIAHLYEQPDSEDDFDEDVHK